MKILIDTNVIMDWLLQREPFFKNAQLVLLAATTGKIDGFVSASSITDIFYLTEKSVKCKDKSRLMLKKLFSAITIATVDSEIIFDAFALEWADFEDSVQYVVAESTDADYIVTRNINDFGEGGIKAIAPEALLDIIAPKA